MMYRIDLLKGEGMPQRASPLGIALSVATVAVPAIALIALSVLALDTRIAIAIRQRELSKVQSSLDRTEQAMKERESLQNRKIAAVACLQEVKGLLARHAQWSPVLEAIAENMPQSLTLTSLRVQQDQARQQRSGKAEAHAVVRRMEIQLQVDGRVTDSEDVRTFRDRLSGCPALSGRLEPIEVTQEPGTSGSRDVTLYQLNCTFKAGR